MPRYTMSQDGEERATFNVSVRITRKDVEKFRQIIARHYTNSPVTDAELRRQVAIQMRIGLSKWREEYKDDGDYADEDE